MEHDKSSGYGEHSDGVYLPTKSKYFPPNEPLHPFVNLCIWVGWAIAALTVFAGINNLNSLPLMMRIGANIAIWWALSRIIFGSSAFNEFRRSVGIVHEGLLHVACHLCMWFFYFMDLGNGFEAAFDLLASGGRLQCISGGDLWYNHYLSHGNPCVKLRGGWMIVVFILACLNVRGVYEVSLRRGEISKIREAKAAELWRMKYEYPYIGDKGEILDLSQVDVEKALANDNIDGVRKALGIDNIQGDDKPR